MSSRLRHSRAHARHHFVCVALKRHRAYLEKIAGLEPRWTEALDLSLGRFADEQPYLGCHRARCGVCHPDKRWHRGPDRLAAKCAWHREWAGELP